MSPMESATPNYLTRLNGVTLTVLGIIGLILTSPLALIGGIIGLLHGLLTQKELLSAALKGAKRASFRSLDAIYLGIELTQTQTQIQEPSPLPSADESEQTHPAPFSPDAKKTPYLGVLKPAKFPSFNNANVVKAFLVEANELATALEIQVIRPKEEEQISTVSEHYIERLISIIKDRTLAKNEFWDRLDQMGNKDIKVFVNQLKTTKAQGKHSLSDLDLLWLYCSDVEMEPSKIASIQNKFTRILRALSEEQLTRSIDSPSFLKLLKIDTYIMGVGRFLNSKQLAVFASDSSKHKTLDSLIKNWLTDPYLLGKIIAVLPYATELLRKNLTRQINFLPQPIAYRTRLANLADHYISANTKTAAKEPEKAKDTNNDPRTKWEPVVISGRVYSKNSMVQQVDVSDEEFEAFLKNFNTTDYYINQELGITQQLNLLPNSRIKALVERAACAEFKNLLRHLWWIESQPIEHKYDIEPRKRRLKIIFEHLTEAQLISSIMDSRFWTLLKNTTDHFCQLVTEVVTPRQFEIIIANLPLAQHQDFAEFIGQLKIDSADKERFKQILELVIPHTTPWTVLPLEQIINFQLILNKPLSTRLKTELKKYLSESLERPEVKSKYDADERIDKNIISSLVVKLPEPSVNEVRLF